MKQEKKQALAEFHRTHIIEASERLFTGHGIEKTTMDDIAKAAGYSKATLYVYFKSKEEIIHVIILQGMRLLYQSIKEQIDREQDDIGTYYAICYAVSDFYGDNPLAYQAAFKNVYSKQHQDELPEVYQDIFQLREKIYMVVNDFFCRGVSHGTFKKQESTQRIVLIFWAALTGIIQMAEQRQEYLSKHAGLTKEDFLKDSFAFLLESVRVRIAR